MRFKRMLFRKLPVVVLLLLFQFAAIGGAILLLHEYYPLFRLANTLAAIAIFFYLINRKETPEFKLPWLFLLLAFPIFGTPMFLIFGIPRLPKKAAAKLKAAKITHRSMLAPTEEQKKLLEALPSSLLFAEKYLQSACHTYGSTGNRVCYYPSGESFYEALLVDLSAAERFIFLEFFIIGDGGMWNGIFRILEKKAKQGVEVRVLYDDIGSAKVLPPNFRRRMQTAGIHAEAFNPFLPVLSVFQNNRDHRKIAVIDGKVGYTGGINIADEYINAITRFGHWKDTAVRIEGNGARQLTALFLQLFGAVTKSASDYEKYLTAPLPEIKESCYAHVFADAPRPFDGELVAEETILACIHGARHSISVMTPYLILNHRLSSALTAAAKRGACVRIFTPHIPDKPAVFAMTRANYRYLLDAGVQIYEYTPGFLHAKTMLFDEEIALVGSVNLDYRSLVHHFECGALLYGGDCIGEIVKDVEKTASRSEKIPQNFRQSAGERFISTVLSLFAPLF